MRDPAKQRSKKQGLTRFVCSKYIYIQIEELYIHEYFLNSEVSITRGNSLYINLPHNNLVRNNISKPKPNPDQFLLVLQSIQEFT